MRNIFSLSLLLNKQFYTPQKTVLIFLSLFSGCVCVLLSSHHYPEFRSTNTTENYQALLSSVRRGGYSQFINDKKELRKQIEKVLSSPENEEQETLASNIALYLFPDLLPDSNFEKSSALGLWAPLQAEIEKRPKSSEARMLYEQMKSNIWNYENPKVSSMGLSKEAIDTLQIYHELSSP